MTAKIRELKLEDIKNVAGGALALSTTTLSTSTSTAVFKPISATSWSLYQSTIVASRY